MEDKEGIISNGFWHFLRRWLWLILAGLMLGVGGGLIFAELTANQSRSNEAEAIIEVAYAFSPYGEVTTEYRIRVDQAKILAARMQSDSSLETLASRLPQEWAPDFRKLRGMVSVFTGTGGGATDTAVSVRVTSDDPLVAREVASELGLLFVEEGQREKELTIERLSQGTSTAIESVLASLTQAMEERQEVLKEAASQIGANDTQYVPYQIVQTRVSALEEAYRSQLQEYLNETILWARLGAPIVLSQEASLSEVEAGIRTREAVLIGGLGGGALGWILASFLDNLGVSVFRRRSKKVKGLRPSYLEEEDDELC